MKIKNVIKKAGENQSGISIYEGKDFFSGYVTRVKAGWVEMICFVYDQDEDRYISTTKLKIALRRITQVYVGTDNDDLPKYQDYPYSDFLHFYYDRKGLYFAETNKFLLEELANKKS